MKQLPDHVLEFFYKMFTDIIMHNLAPVLANSQMGDKFEVTHPRPPTLVRTTRVPRQETVPLLCF